MGLPDVLRRARDEAHETIDMGFPSEVRAVVVVAVLDDGQTRTLASSSIDDYPDLDATDRLALATALKNAGEAIV